MSGEKSITLLFIALGSILFSLFFYVCFDHPVVNDALEYKAIAENLLHNKAYSLSKDAPYLPTTFREPAYPVFLMFLLFVSNGCYAAVYLAQIMLFALTVILVFHLSADIFGRKSAVWIVLITALCPTLANYPSYLLTETIFTFLLMLFMVVILKAAQANKSGWYALAGFVLAVSTLTKSVTIFLFLPICFAGLLYTGSFKVFLKRYLKNFVLFSLVFLIFVAPWAMRNYSEFGKFSLTMRFGKALWARSVKLDYNAEDIKKEIAFSISERLGKKLYPEIEEANRFLLKEMFASQEVIDELTAQGYNEAEVDRIQTKEWLLKIKKYPLKYLSQNFLEAIKMTAFLYVPLLNETHVIQKFNFTERGRVMLSVMRGVFRLLALLVLVLSVLGMFAERAKWRQWIFVACVIVYLNLVYCFIFGWGRYSVPLIPFYFMFTVPGYEFIRSKLICKICR